MSAPRLPISSLSAGERRLPEASARYLARVLRLRAGDRFEAFDPAQGTVADAVLVSIDGEHVTARIEAPVDSDDRTPTVVLVQGYPKGDKLADIVRDATELGATVVVPAICERSVARPEPSKLAARAARLSAVAAEAARQCGRARAPTVLAPMPWSDAIATARAMTTRGFVLYERATEPLRGDLVALANDAAVAVAIGPEGGLSEAEVAFARESGFAPRSLGSIILRTETAATAVLGALRVLRA